MKTFTRISMIALLSAAFSAPTMAADKSAMEQQISCELMKVVAEKIIHQRQNGLVIQAVENRMSELGAEFPQARQMTEDYVQQAFKTPIALDQEQKQQVINQFRKEAYQQCVCQWHSDTI